MTLSETARAMVAPGKGVLAADESTGTMEKRLTGVGIESTEENRRIYRQLLFTTEGVEDFISGVILFDETLRQKADDGRSVPELLNKKGILPGIKVDQGVKEFEGHAGEVVTEGLDGLPERLKEYVGLGARFTKWRAVITIGEGIPSDECIRENAVRLAKYAHMAQNAGLVPIVEPEVLMEGSHSIETCFDVTKRTQLAVFEELKKEGVQLDCMLLKPNMVISGKEATDQVSVDEVAAKTVECLTATVPPEVPGVVFLSGGQSDEQAIAHLSAMNKMGKHPWELSFSYGRGLQQAALKALNGDLMNPDNQKAAQKAFFDIAKKCSDARFGR